jgi:predicted nucleic acid-binding protein
MKVLLDTNIILDIALQRQPYFDESNQLLSLVQEKQLEGYVSASTFGDLYYIIRKAQGRELTLDFLTRLATICRVAAVDEAAITLALNANFRDFEDAIQYSTAAINHLDAIVTRNPQDFTNVTLRIFTPSRLIEELGV